MQISLSDDPDWRSAIDLAAALRRRETSAAETLEAVLERADRWDQF
jgi:Asp-tRNA(Asn)/Glu-tRNA(Gln) amidotransferase A subunit family amidase